MDNAATETKVLPFSARSFDVQVVSPLSSAGLKGRFATEADAIERARGLIGPQLVQVTVQANADDLEAWALRHLTWNAGEVRDSGWRCWIGGEFAGAAA